MGALDHAETPYGLNVLPTDLRVLRHVRATQVVVSRLLGIGCRWGNCTVGQTRSDLYFDVYEPPRHW